MRVRNKIIWKNMIEKIIWLFWHHGFWECDFLIWKILPLFANSQQGEGALTAAIQLITCLFFFLFFTFFSLVLQYGSPLKYTEGTERESSRENRDNQGLDPSMQWSGISSISKLLFSCLISLVLIEVHLHIERELRRNKQRKMERSGDWILICNEVAYLGSQSCCFFVRSHWFWFTYCSWESIILEIRWVGVFGSCQVYWRTWQRFPLIQTNIQNLKLIVRI